MNRFEFTEVLRKSLSGRVDYRVVNENVAYYENYIDTEMRKGRSEEEVLGELGDPRLLAKTISGVAGDGSGTYAEDEDGARTKGGLFGGRVFRLPNWLFWLVVYHFKYSRLCTYHCAAHPHSGGSGLLSDTVFPAEALMPLEYA